MVYYKSYRIVDGKPRWVIEDENGNIDKNPTNDQLKIAIICGWNPRRNMIVDRKCCKCGSKNTRVDNSGRIQWFKYYGEDTKKGWDNKSWLCSNCYHKILNNLSDSHKNIIKSMVKYRNKKLDLDTETGKGIIGECVVGRVLGIRNCENCDILKNYDFHIDPSRGSKWVEFKFDECIYNNAYKFILSNLEYCPVFKIKKEDNV
jgi:hypothetical protein